MQRNGARLPCECKLRDSGLPFVSILQSDGFRRFCRELVASVGERAAAIEEVRAAVLDTGLAAMTENL